MYIYKLQTSKSTGTTSGCSELNLNQSTETTSQFVHVGLPVYFYMLSHFSVSQFPQNISFIIFSMITLHLLASVAWTDASNTKSQNLTHINVLGIFIICFCIYIRQSTRCRPSLCPVQMCSAFSVNRLITFIGTDYKKFCPITFLL